MVLMWVRRIWNDPNIIETGVSEQFLFDEHYIPHFDCGKCHHNWPGSRVREVSNVLVPIFMEKGAGDS